MTGFMYILECADGTYYTGSTTNLEIRLEQHQSGDGANHTKKRLPVKLVYAEQFDTVETAFHREKQVQGWNRRKKEALISGNLELLTGLSIAYRDGGCDVRRGLGVSGVSGFLGFEGFENLSPRSPRSLSDSLPEKTEEITRMAEALEAIDVLEGNESRKHVWRLRHSKPLISSKPLMSSKVRTSHLRN